MTFSFLFLCGDKFNAQTNLVRAFVSFSRCIEICLNSNVRRVPTGLESPKRQNCYSTKSFSHVKCVFQLFFFLVFIKSFWVEPNGIWIGAASPTAQLKATFVSTMNIIMIIIIMVPDSPASTHKWQNVGKWCAHVITLNGGSMCFMAAIVVTN